MPRLPCSHVHQGWPCSAVPSSREGPQAPLRLVKLDTIRSSEEISAIFKHGTRSSNSFLTLIIREAECDEDGKTASEHGRHGRVAFIAGKKSGNACWRNAAKRRMRELARQVNAPWPGYDVLFVAKRAVTDASYSKVLTATKDTVGKSVLGKMDVA